MPFTVTALLQFTKTADIYCYQLPEENSVDSIYRNNDIKK